MINLSFLHLFEFVVSFVIEFIDVAVVLVFVDRCQSCIAQELLCVLVFLKLEDEFIDFLMSSTDLPLTTIGSHLKSVQLFLELCDLFVFAFDLLFFDGEQTLHVLVLVLQGDDSDVARLVLVQKLAKCFICLRGVLLHFTLDQFAVIFSMRYALLNKLLSGIKGANLASFGMK